MYTKQLRKKIDNILKRYKYIETEINDIELVKEELLLDFRGCGAIRYGDIGGSSGSISSTVENEVIKRENEIEKLDVKKEKKLLEKRRIDNFINGIDDTDLKEFFELHYNSKRKNSITQISFTMNLSTTKVSNLKKELLLQYYKKLIKPYN